MAARIEQHLVEQLARRMAVRIGLGAAITTVALRAARPHPAWMAAGAIWAIYELSTAKARLDVSRMRMNILNDAWEVEDMAVFRKIFQSLEVNFLLSDDGKVAKQQQLNYILIPKQIMPMIAQVDLVGMGKFGNQLIYDRTGRKKRRSAATSGAESAGLIQLGSGVSVPGSWEEYPFAVTYAPNHSGSHIGRVPLTENWSQGGLIAAAKYYQDIQDGEKVVAYVV